MRVVRHADSPLVPAAHRARFDALVDVLGDDPDQREDFSAVMLKRDLCVGGLSEAGVYCRGVGGELPALASLPRWAWGIVWYPQDEALLGRWSGYAIVRSWDARLERCERWRSWTICDALDHLERALELWSWYGDSMLGMLLRDVPPPLPQSENGRECDDPRWWRIVRLGDEPAWVSVGFLGRRV